MRCKIAKSKISGKITCPPNKSYTHRAFFISSLADGTSTIKNALRSADTNATLDACKSFGAQIQDTGGVVTITGLKKIDFENIKIDAANSGTTIRIAAAIASLSKNKTELTGDHSLQQRPMQPLLDALADIGAKCTSNNGNPPVTITGKVHGTNVSISGNISSQFISGLMIAAPNMPNGLTLNIKGDLVSKPYLDATIATMKKFNVDVQVLKSYEKYKISPSRFKATTIIIPSDFSSLALLLSAAVLIGDNFSIQITKSDLKQGDEKILEILKNLGVSVLFENDEISVKSPEKLVGGKFDLNNTPDLLPPLAILALKTSKSIEIHNVKHARFKETDRISIISRELQKLGIKIQEKDDGMILDAPKKVTNADLNSENDHRLFMAFCIAGMYVGNCTVSDPESIEISYPNFISDMNKVGGKIELS